MAGRLSDAESRRASIAELGAVTDAMRSLAAVRLQQATSMLDGTRAYAGVIADALARALPLLGAKAVRWPAEERGNAAVLLFAPEHGFVGAFTDRLAEAALSLPGPRALWVVGSRGAALLEDAGKAPAWSAAMATHTDAVTATVHRVAEALYRVAADGRLDRMDIVYGRAEPGAPPVVVREPLLPLDLTRFRSANGGERPLTNLPPPRLVARLVDEYVFALLAQAALESFAAENAARLAVMMAAHRNIEGTLEDLTGEIRRLWQEQITTELIELASGSEALRAGIAGTVRMRHSGVW
ncbi:F0F1 ATP synthase subunit gamma [Azospirillum sp. sgz302134]